MKPTHIIIHHSLTKDGITVSWGGIRKYHIDPNGPYKMRDIGYHFGIELIGDYYEILVGRPETEVGAHCSDGGMNHHSIGICVVGNYDVDILPEMALKQLVRLVKSLMITWNIPKTNIKRHHDYASKSCPGIKFPWANFLSMI